MADPQTQPATDPSQIQGLPAGAILKPIPPPAARAATKTAMPNTTIEGLPPGAILKPLPGYQGPMTSTGIAAPQAAPTPRTPNQKIGDDLTDLIGGAAKSLAKISGPNVMYELFRKHFPQANLPPALGMPNEQEVIKNGILMMLPEAEGEASLEEPAAATSSTARATSPKAAPTAMPKAASVLEHPGVSPWVDAAKAEVMKLPGMNLAKMLYRSARGFSGAEEAPPAPAPPPVPETNGIPWGTRGAGPLALRGKMIPPEAPGVFPGAPLPETPAPELLQANALAEGGRAPTEPAAAALGRIPPPQLPDSAPPSIVRRPGEVPPMMIRPRAFSPRNVEPIPPRPGLMLPPGKAGSMAESVSAPPPPTASWPPDLSSSIEQRPIPGSPEDIAETRNIQEQIRDAAEAEDATRLAREKAEWFRRNTVQDTKGDLIAKAKAAATPPDNAAISTASASTPKATPATNDLTGILKKSVAAAKRAKALKAGKPVD